MLVEIIFQFIKSFPAEKSPIDEVLYNRINTFFSNYNDNHSLNAQDVKLLENCFETRWFHIKNTAADYTLDSDGINELWINLAKKTGH